MYLLGVFASALALSFGTFTSVLQHNRVSREGVVDSFTVLIEDSKLINFSKNVQVTLNQSDVLDC
jgi:hypothetical protein